MMSSRYVKRSMVVAAMFISCAAFAQEQADDVVATIESDSPEALELFVDWAGIRARVRAAFRIQGMEMPEGMEDWLAESRGKLTIAKDKIEIRSTAASERQTRDFVDELFHVFRNSAFRQLCIELLYQEMENLQMEAESFQTRSSFGGGAWRDPEQISRELRDVQENLFQMDLIAAETNARLLEVHKRMQQYGGLAEKQIIAAELKVRALHEAVENHRKLIERTLQLEENGHSTEGDVDEVQLRLLEQESVLAEQLAVLEGIRQGQGDEMIRELKNVLIESESELASTLASRELIKRKVEKLHEDLNAASKLTSFALEYESRIRKITHLMEQISEEGSFPLIPVDGVPKLRLRWVN